MRILYSPNREYAFKKKKYKNCCETLVIELAKMTITSQAREPDWEAPRRPIPMFNEKLI